MCCTFLAGNDFVPQLPSLDIYDRPSALQTLLDKYKARGGGRVGCVRPSSNYCFRAAPAWDVSAGFVADTAPHARRPAPAVPYLAQFTAAK